MNLPKWGRDIMVASLRNVCEGNNLLSHVILCSTSGKRYKIVLYNHPEHSQVLMVSDTKMTPKLHKDRKKNVAHVIVKAVADIGF